MQHRNLAAGRWQTLTLAEQLGNIGSEVGRAVHARDSVQRTSAGYRALELFDLTLADRRWYHRGSEVGRAREVVGDFLFGGNTYHSTAASLENYFMQFALVARRDR